MKVERLVVVLLVVGMAFAGLARADKAEDAVALVDKAVNMFKEQGSESTLKAINDPKGPFVKGDLYVFAVSMGNVMLGHPHEHSIRRMSVSNIQDATGNPLFQRLKEVAEKDGSGWVEYMWGKPGADKPSRKRTFVKKVPDQNVYVGAGWYSD